jgi:hypothetical protein
MRHLRFTLVAVGVALGLFLAMLLFVELGRRLGLRQAKKHGNEARAGVGVVDGSVYALLALLIGFTFSGAAGRFEQRQQLIAAESNVAGTAWQRIALLPPGQQVAIRDALRGYVDALIGWYAEAVGPVMTVREPAAVTRAQDEVWSRSVAACLAPGGDPARMLLLPALNELFGAVEQERMARRIHPPRVIFAMLGIAALAAALFAGYGMASGKARNWMYIIGVAATVSVAVYVILELEYPRLGLFRVNEMDQALIELRETMR